MQGSKGSLILLIFFATCFSILLSEEHYLSRDTIRAIADFVLDNTGEERFYTQMPKPIIPSKVKHGDIIFVQTDLLGKFFAEYFPHIQCKFILISHNADESAPGPYAHYLNDPKIILWFGQNGDIVDHPKFRHIPIGLASQRYNHGSVAIMQQARSQLLSITKNKLLYLNMQPNTFPRERNFVDAYFSTQPFCTRAYNRPQHLYLQDLAESCFVISPRGNGLDCHRTWEILLMRSYPVVKTSTLDPLYTRLPVVIVKNWNEVTKSLLERKYKEFSSRQYDFSILFIEYWINEINMIRMANPAT